MPTILAFAGLNDPDKVRYQLNKNFSLALPLQGHNLAKYLYSNKKSSSNIVYFFTEDQSDNGPNQINLLCQAYNHVPQPCNVDCILTFIDGILWKLTRYYNKNGYCTDEKPCISSTNTINGEMYNLKNDPMELNNLIFDSKFQDTLNFLNSILIEKSFIYRGSRGSSVRSQYSSL